MRRLSLLCLVPRLPVPARAEDPALARLFERTGVGWYVGYAETPRDAADQPLRQRLVREALRAKGIVE